MRRQKHQLKAARHYSHPSVPFSGLVQAAIGVAPEPMGTAENTLLWPGHALPGPEAGGMVEFCQSLVGLPLAVSGRRWGELPP